MSANPWLLEAESGRYYMPWVDQFGRPTRRYSDELYPESSSLNQAPSSQEYHVTPRSESSQRTKGRSTTSSHYSSSTSRRSHVGRDRRPSESGSKRPEDIPEYDERSDPIPIINASSSREYHGSGGYNQPPHDEYPAADDYGPATASSGFQATPSNQFSNNYGQSSAHHWTGTSEDTGLLPSMTSLSIGDTNNNFTFSKEHSSAPAAAYLDNRNQVQWTSVSSPDPGFYSGSYQDKGKGVELTHPGTQTPRPSDTRHIAGTDGEREMLDKSYKVRNQDYKSWFTQGRVFCTLYTDALGSVTNEYDSQFMSTVSVVQFGEKVYSTIRRFVVVRFDKGANSCVCLPVTTYNGRGIGKRGIRLDQHGQIFSGEKAPRLFDGIVRKALRVKLSGGAQRLDSRSCINYGNPYTIQTNVKVKDVGELDSESKRLLRKYFNEVNTVPEDDLYPDPSLPRTAADRAADLTGMGGALSDTAGSYPGTHPSSFVSSGHLVGSYDTYQTSSHVQHGSGWTPNSDYVSAGQNSVAAGSAHDSHTGQTPQVVSSSVNLPNSAVPASNMNHPSTSDPRQRDDQYIDSSSSVVAGGPNALYPGAQDPAYADSQFSSTLDASSTWSAAGSSPIHQGQSYPDEVVLPTLEEAEASRTSRRYSTNQHGGSGRTHARDRDRERDRDRDRDRERERQPEYRQEHDRKERDKRGRKK